MAKKNSSKTQTQEARQASEPKLQVFAQWGGINISEQAPDWKASEQVSNTADWQRDPETDQTDLPSNFLVCCNNVDITDTKKLQTRRPVQLLPTTIRRDIDSDGKKEMVTIIPNTIVVKEDYIIAAFSDNRVRMCKFDVEANQVQWKRIPTKFYIGAFEAMPYYATTRNLTTDVGNIAASESFRPMLQYLEIRSDTGHALPIKLTGTAEE